LLPPSRGLDKAGSSSPGSLLEGLKNDRAAKRRKKHKKKISELVISMCDNEQRLKF
jgi:hypothetical protein